MYGEPRSGDPCPACGGLLYVRTSTRRGLCQSRQLRCKACEYHVRVAIPAERIHRRRVDGCMVHTKVQTTGQYEL
jgi:DNA-directed RNA polymerase subunit M/transcription elongation factor TFIIS